MQYVRVGYAGCEDSMRGMRNVRIDYAICEDKE